MCVQTCKRGNHRISNRLTNKCGHLNRADYWGWYLQARLLYCVTGSGWKPHCYLLKYNKQNCIFITGNVQYYTVWWLAWESNFYLGDYDFVTCKSMCSQLVLNLWPCWCWKVTSVKWDFWTGSSMQKHTCMAVMKCEKDPPYYLWSFRCVALNTLWWWVG